MQDPSCDLKCSCPLHHHHHPVHIGSCISMVISVSVLWLHRQQQQKTSSVADYSEQVVGSCVLHAWHGHHVKLINPHPPPPLRRHGHDPASHRRSRMDGYIDLTNRCGDLLNTTREWSVLDHGETVKQSVIIETITGQSTSRKLCQVGEGEDEKKVKSGHLECTDFWYSSEESLLDHSKV